LTLLLDLGVAHARERTRGRDLLGGASPDRIERERDDFFERVRDGFLARATAHPQRIRVLDASPDAATVAASALAALADYRKGLQ
jgi:dTMP kinase